MLKKISTGWNEIGQWFLPIGTKYELFKAAENFLKDNRVDIIITTGEPFILFKYASQLSENLISHGLQIIEILGARIHLDARGCFLDILHPFWKKNT